MIKEIWKTIEHFIFEDEEEINEAQYLTLLSLAKKTYLTHGGKSQTEAARLAVVIVEKWITSGEHKKYLKNLWKNLKAA